MPEKNQGYGDILRMKMKTKDNAQKRPITIRDLERSLGKSYEHFRRIINDGGVAVSSDLNIEICKYLGLDADKMWSIAEAEKNKIKFERFSKTRNFAPPADPRFREIWPRLTPADLTRLLTIAEGMAAANEAQGIAIRRVASK